MSELQPNKSTLREWQTGACVCDSDCESLLATATDLSIETLLEEWRGTKPVSRRLVVVSQTCDTVMDDYVVEPFVELLLLVESEQDGQSANFLRRKSSRALDMPVDGANDSSGRILRALFRHKILVLKASLLRCRVDLAKSLRQENACVLMQWIAQRYARAAFPDAFNEAIALSADKSRRWLRTLANGLVSMRLQLNQNTELEDPRQYSGNLYLIFKAGRELIDAESRAAGELTKFIEGKLPLVKVSRHDESTFSLLLFNSSQLLPVEDMSFSPRNGSAIGPTTAAA